MRLQALIIALAAAGIADANATQAVCSQQGSGEKTLSRVNADYIEVRSGSTTRSVPIADIQSIDVTGPVNRINRVAWATLKTRQGQTQNVGIALPNAGTLVIDGVGAQGGQDSIDLLNCKRVSFSAGS